MTIISIMDLFCGTGGFSWGFHKLDFRIKVSIDNWKVAAENYSLNFPGTEVLLIDILELDPSNFGNIDIIIGSPPCKEFSIARSNRWHIKYPDLTLVAKFFEFVRELRPKIFIMENVPNILNYLNFKPFIILNAADYGVPQVRKRVFFGLEKKPSITHSKFKSLDPNIKLWQKASKFLELPNEDSYKILYSHSIDCRANSPFKTIHAPARTITTRAPKIVKRNEVIRDLTIKEMAKLQSFPEEFKFNATNTQCYRMIGNAVPPKLSLVIAKMIKEKWEEM